MFFRFERLTVVKRNNRISLEPLKEGQVWRMKDADLHVQTVGKMLVHYKLFKGKAKRAPTSLSGKDVVERYLETNNAILAA